MLLLLAGKMFTTGRIVFSVLFVIAFVLVMVFSYKKDAKNNEKYYKNTAMYVAVGIVLVIGLLFLAKFLIKG